MLQSAVEAVASHQLWLQLLDEDAEETCEKRSSGLQRVVIDFLSLMSLPTASSFFESEVGRVVKPAYERFATFCRCAAYLLNINTATPTSAQDMLYFVNYNGNDGFCKYLCLPAQSRKTAAVSYRTVTVVTDVIRYN